VRSRDGYRGRRALVLTSALSILHPFRMRTSRGSRTGRYMTAQRGRWWMRRSASSGTQARQPSLSPGRAAGAPTSRGQRP
jgi:hypothetical protein